MKDTRLSAITAREAAALLSVRYRGEGRWIPLFVQCKLATNATNAANAYMFEVRRSFACA